MRVTKTQLRRIIREEKRKVLAENRVRRLVRRALREADEGKYSAPEWDAIHDKDAYPNVNWEGWRDWDEIRPIPDVYSDAVRRMITQPPVEQGPLGGKARSGIYGHDLVSRGGFPVGRSNWADMKGVDLSGENLTNLEFVNVDFSGADFSGADLQGSVLGQGDYRGADFRNANMSGTELDLLYAAFSGADFTGASMDPALARELENPPKAEWEKPQEEGPEVEEGIPIEDWFDVRSRRDGKDDILSYVSEDEVIAAGWADFDEAYQYTDSGEEIFDRLADDVQERIKADLGVF